MQPIKPIRLSIAAPAYNEGSGIQSVIEAWIAFLKTQETITTFEIVVCNDGSQDHTGNILDALACQYSEVHPLHFTHNQGAAAALAEAIQHTQFEWVLLLDSDNQFPIENLSRLLSVLHDPSARAVMGIRHKKNHIFARWGSQWSGCICNKIYHSRLKDFNSAFKLVYGPALRSFKLEAKGLNYSTEITAQLLEHGITLFEVDIDHRSRDTDKSSMKWLRDSMHRFLFVLYLAWKHRLIKWGVLRMEKWHEPY